MCNLLSGHTPKISSQTFQPDQNWIQAIFHQLRILSEYCEII